MSTAIKAVIATILTLVLIFVIAFLEMNYTNGAICVGILLSVAAVSLWLVFYTVFND